MNRTLSIVASLALFTIGCGGAGANASSASSKADSGSFSYTCTNSDISFSVSPTAPQFYIQNSEAGVAMDVASQNSRTATLKADPNADDSDTSLMGSKATVSVGALSGAATVTLDLLGGESGGTYTCTLD